LCNIETVAFLRELFETNQYGETIKIKKASPSEFNIYVIDHLALCVYFDGEKISFSKPQSMGVKAKFIINDKNIDKIRKFVAGFWIAFYTDLAKDRDEDH